MRHLVLIPAVWIFSSLPSAMACVGCRQPEVNSSEEPQTILAGVAFSWSVITLLVFVLAILAFLTAYIARTCQRLDREKNPS